jgi:hypothetical protein
MKELNFYTVAASKRKAATLGRDLSFWSWWTESNPRPADYKSAALPAELHQHYSAVCRHVDLIMRHTLLLINILCLK